MEEKEKDPESPKGEWVGAGGLHQPGGKEDGARGIASTQLRFPGPGPWPVLRERVSVTSTKRSLAGKKERTKVLIKFMRT